MSDAPTNAAVEWMRLGFAHLNRLDGPPSDYWLADDFWAEDRRALALWGAWDAEAFVEQNNALWRVGRSSPTWELREVIAIRGDECAAARVIVGLGDGYGTETIFCNMIDSIDGRLRRQVFFDPEDREDAIALLDAWHTESGDPASSSP